MNNSSRRDLRNPRDGGILFVDNVRFWSMVGIVVMHCAILVWPPPGESLPFSIQFGIQLAKFATVAFFLVAGYLLGKQLPRYTRTQYFWRRLGRLGPAWLVWFSLFCALLAVGHHIVHPSVPRGLGQSIPVFSSTFWFVPNLVFAMLILLVISRYFNIDDWRCGLVLLLPSLFYAIDIYTKWVEPRHTAALAGFVFYLWLGAWTSRHWDRATAFLSRISTLTLVGLSLSFLLLGILESRLLVLLHSADPMNSLRFSNQLYSISVVLLFSRITVRTWPRFLDVREHTYGVYLAQDPINGVIGFGLKYAIATRLGAFGNTNLGLLSMWGLRFALVYALSLSATVLAARTSFLSWTVGATHKTTNPNKTHNPAAAQISPCLLPSADLPNSRV